jgi:pimeloyl-ACP methyl ester carboxylesterase
MGDEPITSSVVKAASSVREAGAGPGVLCIHSFASNLGQYRGLMQRLAPHFRVVAADLYGHGDAAAWTDRRRITLADEAAPLEALFADGEPMHLVGHSYGAAVALHIATTQPTCVRSMVLYEPTIWGTLSQLYPGDPATLEIEAVRDDTVRLVHAEDIAAASERFVDYWGGKGAWAVAPEKHKPKLMETVRLLGDGWHAAFAERWSKESLSRLEVPCLLLTGSHTTAAARRAVQLLHESLPHATVIELQGLGHLGPMTHPERVDPAIEAFLDAQQALTP